MKTELERNARKINHVRKKINAGRMINRDILKVFVFFAILFSGLIVFAVYFLAFRAETVINNSYNRRSDILSRSVIRGRILAEDGTELALSAVSADGSQERIYPYENVFAHVVGFDSNGKAGLESAYNYYLLTSHANLIDKITNEFNGLKNPGDDLVTTLNAGLQEYIYMLMGDNNGAAVCMDPETGKILAMVSKPDFDPNWISEIWDSLVSEEEDENPDASTSESVLLNRATQGLYTPGSTFKIFTLYEFYLEHPELVNNYSYNCKGIIRVGDTTLSCLDGEAHGHENLMDAFANSCNCVFGSIGSQLDLTRFRETNEKLLFGTRLPVDIPSAVSIYHLSEKDTEFDIMATAIGQGNTQMTPMHLAMVISSIANDGVCMKPYLADRIANSSGNTVKQYSPEEYIRLFSPSEAEFLKSYLRAVVTQGTGYAVYPGNFQAYGKTGTAQKENDEKGSYDHSWFAGWAENNGQKLAVCVILEDADEAGTRAVYLTKDIFDYYFGY